VGLFLVTAKKFDCLV